MPGSVIVKYNFRMMSISSKQLETGFKEINKTFKTGVKEFLKVIDRKVPTYSGMARAAFLNLANAVKYHFYISPKSHTKPSSKGGKPRPVKRRVMEGINASKFTLGFNGKSWDFEYRNDVPHFNVNDQINAKQLGFHLKRSTPWRSIIQAEANMVSYIEGQLRRIVKKLGPQVEFRSFKWSRFNPVRAEGKIPKTFKGDFRNNKSYKEYTRLGTSFTKSQFKNIGIKVTEEQQRIDLK